MILSSLTLGMSLTYQMPGLDTIHIPFSHRVTTVSTTGKVESESALCFMSIATD